MKPKILPFLYILLGFLFAAVIQMLTYCNRDDDFLRNSISADELRVKIDEKAMNQAIDQYRTAFTNADRKSLSSFTIDDSYQYSGVGLAAYTDEELAEIGSAMRKAKLNIATANFAEFTYSIGKADFTFTMGLDDDGIWKLLRY